MSIHEKITGSKNNQNVASAKAAKEYDSAKWEQLVLLLFLIKMIGILAKQSSTKDRVDTVQSLPGLAQDSKVLPGVVVNRFWILSII